MIWSPSTSSPVLVDREHPVGVAVEREPDVGAVRDAPRACSSLGVGRAAAVVDVRAVGRGVRARRPSAPSARSTRGRDLGTRRRCAQSTHHAQAVEPAALERRRRGARRSRRARRGARSTIADADARRAPARASLDRERRAARPRPRASSVVGELAAAGREQLDAVVAERVVAGRDHRRRRAALARERTRRRAWAARRASTTSAPSAQMPGDERGLEHRARARGCRGR